MNDSVFLDIATKVSSQQYVGLYARVSTKDKDQNPENQLQPLRELCDLHHLKYKEFVDFESGKTDRTKYRLGLTELLNELDEGTLAGVLVLNTDRFARSQEIGHTLIGNIRRTGKFFFAVENNRYIDKAHYGQDESMGLGLDLILAEGYSLRQSKAVKAGYIRKKKATPKGEQVRWGRKPMMGGRMIIITLPNGDITEKMVFDVIIDPIKVKKMHEDGMGIRAISRELNVSTTPIKRIIDAGGSVRISK